MLNTHPLQQIPLRYLLALFVLLLILTAVNSFLMSQMSEPLITEQAKRGILSFEFATTAQRSQEILDSWDSQTKLAAGLTLQMDFLFLLVYSTTLGIGCLLISRSQSDPRFSQLGIILAWLQWGAGLADVFENFALLQVISGSMIFFPLIAALFASIKFGLIFLGVAYIAIGSCLILIPKSGT